MTNKRRNSTKDDTEKKHAAGSAAPPLDEGIKPVDSQKEAEPPRTVQKRRTLLGPSNTTQVKVEHTKAGEPYVEHSSDAIWSVCVAEAKKFDEPTIEGWKKGMDSILIFAGLFSAVVTAFIVESYKSLQPDQTATTIALLGQISNQLANGSATVFTPPTPFIVPSSAVRANALWLLSLSFSLACALAATLVQQWLHNYVHAILRYSAPRKKARIRQYLFEGLESFGMATLVTAIPTLLHISLFLFFGGLYEFFRPINPAIGFLVLGILVVCGVLYLGAAIVAAFNWDCPYRVPLSGLIQSFIDSLRWLVYLIKHVSAFLRECYKYPGWPMSANWRDSDIHHYHVGSDMEAQTDADSAYHDERALHWTMRVLIDSDELEPMVKGIPGFLVSTDLEKGAAAKTLSRLYSRQRIEKRLEQLWRSCDTSSPRRVTCMTALWMMILSMKKVRLDFTLIDWLDWFPRRDEPSASSQWKGCLATLFLCHHSSLGLEGVESWIRDPHLVSLANDLRDSVWEHRLFFFTCFLEACALHAEGPLEMAIRTGERDASALTEFLTWAMSYVYISTARPTLQAAFVQASVRAFQQLRRPAAKMGFLNALAPCFEYLTDRSTRSRAADFLQSNQWVVVDYAHPLTHRENELNKLLVDWNGRIERMKVDVSSEKALDTRLEWIMTDHLNSDVGEALLTRSPYPIDVTPQVERVEEIRRGHIEGQRI